MSPLFYLTKYFYPTSWLVFAVFFVPNAMVFLSWFVPSYCPNLKYPLLREIFPKHAIRRSPFCPLPPILLFSITSYCLIPLRCSSDLSILNYVFIYWLDPHWNVKLKEDWRFCLYCSMLSWANSRVHRIFIKRIEEGREGRLTAFFFFRSIRLSR